MSNSQNQLRIVREWAMPSADTLSVRPIRQWVKSLLHGCEVVVDPFARNCRVANWRNDLSPDTDAEFHMDAEEFLNMLRTEKALKADAIIFDPPYSPRQITEVYQSVGRKVTMEDTQSAVLYQRVRDAADMILKPNGIVLSFGWNSVGMGLSRSYKMFDMLVVCHGGAHNDTICVAERKVMADQYAWW